MASGTPGDTFAALLMAVLRRADKADTEALGRAFPCVCEEFYARYQAPGGDLGESGRG